jgi:hypothetical protein
MPRVKRRAHTNARELIKAHQRTRRGQQQEEGEAEAGVIQRGGEDLSCHMRRACDYCVKQKRACTGNARCFQCTKRGLVCHYSERRKSGPRRPRKDAYNNEFELRAVTAATAPLDPVACAIAIPSRRGLRPRVMRKHRSYSSATTTDSSDSDEYHPPEVERECKRSRIIRHEATALLTTPRHSFVVEDPSHDDGEKAAVTSSRSWWLEEEDNDMSSSSSSSEDEHEDDGSHSDTHSEGEGEEKENAFVGKRDLTVGFDFLSQQFRVSQPRTAAPPALEVLTMAPAYGSFEEVNDDPVYLPPMTPPPSNGVAKLIGSPSSLDSAVDMLDREEGAAEELDSRTHQPLLIF